MKTCRDDDELRVRIFGVSMQRDGLAFGIAVADLVS